MPESLERCGRRATTQTARLARAAATRARGTAREGDLARSRHAPRALCERAIRPGRRRRVLERKVVSAQRAARQSRVRRAAHGERVAGLLATDINPSTATITELEYAARRSRDGALSPTGREERIPLDALERFIAVGETTPAPCTTRPATTTQRCVRDRRVDSPFLARGFVVADTPGLASINPAHRRATLALSCRRRRGPLPDRHAAAVHAKATHRSSGSSASTSTRSSSCKRRSICGAHPKATDARPGSTRATASRGTPRVHAHGTRSSRSRRANTPRACSTDDAALARAQPLSTRCSPRSSVLAECASRSRRRACCSVPARRARTRRAHAFAPSSARGMLARAAKQLASERAQALEARAARTRTRARAGSATRLLRAGRGARGLDRDARRGARRELVRALAQRVRHRRHRKAARSRKTAHPGRRDGRRRAWSVRRATSPDTLRARSIARSASATHPGRCAGRRRGGAALRRANPAAARGAAISRAAIAATIVLEALGGRRCSFVHDDRDAFAARPHGTYMKRELIADLRAKILPRLRTRDRRLREVASERAAAAPVRRSRASVARAVAAQRDAELGAIERALQRARPAATSPRAKRGLRERARGDRQRSAAARELVAGFTERDEDDRSRRPESRGGSSRDGDARSIPDAYDRGLRPERWRVAVFGALRRGKSSLINAIAGTTVLTDDVGRQRSALSDPRPLRRARTARMRSTSDGEWNEIDAVERRRPQAADRARSRARCRGNFPSNSCWCTRRHSIRAIPTAEEVALAAAGAASEVLGLFSRQLSDRELELYDARRRARQTDAASPTRSPTTKRPNERRHVVELAERYLRERGIATPRIFTVSALEYSKPRSGARRSRMERDSSALRQRSKPTPRSHMERLPNAYGARGEKSAARSMRPAEHGRQSRTEASRESTRVRLLGARLTSTLGALRAASRTIRRCYDP